MNHLGEPTCDCQDEGNGGDGGGEDAGGFQNPATEDLARHPQTAKKTCSLKFLIFLEARMQTTPTRQLRRAECRNEGGGG